MPQHAESKGNVAIIGGGPAGLMAAEVLTERGVQVDLFDTMPSVGRKFLMAGKGGLNLTHSESREPFLARYGDAADRLTPMLLDFGPDQLRAWATRLGIDTFVGSSGRVFPTEMKAAPLLRAWLHRLRHSGVRFHVRHRWLAMDRSGESIHLDFAAPGGGHSASFDVVIFALGGGSWAKLGSDGAWVEPIASQGIAVTPLRPANCGFDCGWSDHFSSRFAGVPLKSVTGQVLLSDGRSITRQGDCVVTATGVEGGLIYALAAPLRDCLEFDGSAILYLDLSPGRSMEWLEKEISQPRGSRSISTHLQSRVGLHGVKSGLLRECTGKEAFSDPRALAKAIKHLPVRIKNCRPIDEAISTAGGVSLNELTDNLMSTRLPGAFFCGEMLDWEAPTGGYLLTACFSTGYRAGMGVLNYLKT